MISPLASVDPQARIGNNVTISPFAYVEGDVSIGEGTWIGPHAVLMKGTRVGSNCKIFPGAVIGAVPQDLKYEGEETTTEIGNNTVIREYCTINRGTKDKWKTTVGDNCLLMAYVHVAHDCEVGNHVILANCVNLAGHVVIGDWAILEGYVGIVQFIHVGAHSFIAGQCGARKNVPPYVKAAREPLSYVGVNTVGLRRRGFSNETIQQIEDMYRTLYVRGLNISNAVDVIAKEAPDSAEKNHILEFIRGSKDGIIRGMV